MSLSDGKPPIARSIGERAESQPGDASQDGPAGVGSVAGLTAHRDPELQGAILSQLESLLAQAPDQPWQGMACHYGLVLLVLEASEGALRQAELHRSADEFDRLRRRFLRSRREEQGPIGQLQIQGPLEVMLSSLPGPVLANPAVLVNP